MRLRQDRIGTSALADGPVICLPATAFDRACRAPLKTPGTLACLDTTTKALFVTSTAFTPGVMQVFTSITPDKCPLVVALRRDGDTFVAELVRADGAIFWPSYASDRASFSPPWPPSSGSR